MMVCDAVFAALSSSVSGLALKYLGRIVIFIFAGVLHLFLFVVLIFWKPNDDDTIVYFLIAAGWGTANGIWQTQINGKLVLPA